MSRTNRQLFWLPNFLTLLRAAGALLLLLTEPFSGRFWALYLVCGLTDLLDGWLARLLHAESALGARLDSMADAAFITVCLVRILPRLCLERWLWCWIGVIAAVRLAALLISALKYRHAAFVHTLANKATGLLLFASPVLFHWMGANGAGVLLCAAASLSAAEELILQLRSKRLNLNQKGLLFLNPKGKRWISPNSCGKIKEKKCPILRSEVDCMFWNKRSDDREKPLEIALLQEAVDDVQLSFIKGVLEGAGIHVLVKERESGDYMRVIAGTSIYGRDVYVEKSLLLKAQELLAEYEGETDEAPSPEE